MMKYMMYIICVKYSYSFAARYIGVVYVISPTDIHVVYLSIFSEILVALDNNLFCVNKLFPSNSQSILNNIGGST